MVATAQLPPLILHPFSGGGSTDQLLDGSKASIALQDSRNPGNLGQKSADRDAELERRVILGRYQEIRMLLFLGKDLFRWAQQCVDFIERSHLGAGGHLTVSEQTFTALVVEDPPAGIDEKLQKW